MKKQSLKKLHLVKINDNLKTISQTNYDIPTSKENIHLKTSIYNATRSNSISKIIGKSKLLSSQNTIQQLYNPLQQSHLMLIQIRKKHDQIKKITSVKKQQIQKSKTQIKTLKQKFKQWQQFTKQQTAELDFFSNKFKKMMDNVEQSTYYKQCYLSVCDRIKLDNIILKSRVSSADMILQQLNVKIKAANIESNIKKSFCNQSKKMQQSIQKVIKFQAQHRQKIISATEILTKKHQNNFQKSQSQRNKNLQQIILNALYGKSSQQKKWQQIYFTNHFLYQILKAKMQRQRIKYQPISKAFQFIKIKTGITQCNIFVQKFLNRELDYGILLETISQREAILLRQEKQNARLKNMEQRIRQYSEQEPSSKQKIVEIDYSKNLRQINQKYNNIYNQKQKLYQFLITFLKKINKFSNFNKNTVNYYEMYPRHQLIQLYKIVEGILLKNLVENTQTTINLNKPIIQTIQQQQLNKLIKSKNVRIRTQQFKTQVQKNNLYLQDQIQKQYLQQYRNNIKKVINKRFRIKSKLS